MKLITIITVFSILFQTLNGNPVDIQTRIVGGSITTINKFPFMVSLRSRRGQHFCGGTLLNRKWVLTAAHCLMTGLLGSVVGGTNLAEEKPKFESRVVDLLENGYSDNQFTNDIALIELETPFTDPFFKYVTLEKTYNDEVRDVLTVGWGRTKLENKKGSNELKSVRGKVQTYEECKNNKLFVDYFRKERQLKNNEFCVDYPKNEGSCKGDSGGPNLVGTEGNYTQVGVVSMGWECAEYPIISARVSSHYNWIQKIIRKM